MISPVIALEVTQVYTVDDVPTDILIQGIVTDKSSYAQGETAKITGHRDVAANCNNLEGVFILKDSNGVNLDTAQFPVGKAGWSTQFYEVRQDTSDLAVGTYTVESFWFCDDSFINEDGNKGSKFVESINFKVRSSGGIPPKETCNRLCDPGYKLVGDGSDCDCLPEWTPDDGRCEVGDVSADCDEKRVCPEDQLKLDGICVFPEDICEKDGGLNDCSGSNPLKYVNLGMYAVGILLVIGGGYLSFGKK